MFYRTEKTVINELMINMLSNEIYVALRAAVANSFTLNEHIIYSLPEGLWVFCITLTSKPFYIQGFNRRISCIIIPLIYSLGLEVCQLFRLTNGQFDFIDIFISIMFWIIAYYFFDDHAKKQNILKSLNIKSMACFASYGIVYLSHVLE